ncbi:K(+)-transporting ATPase subunit C [Clostridium beijerinckii]|uniref:K(+)-transporting ATPase subunit C n=1 Tax=Clostridium beijerinckii TaxID=1520 RepID=UPI00098CDA80|nr:K(+)-transporting ATPase subunit C [Clostridium beijerinckii]MBA8937057.1 K+-transporting ATPase ATPase C chain [Clostridium beijerinckii]NOW03018.1 K+-transporting ATPase ATPase C chain [Clostridium beijerinckii]NRT33832.1 K+-transporting ATPase ATPase C chain [Clostridium beijerinckii]NRT46738.1 K+-transporting ATPase ATPase C chain [Clostridium beijerinckii]NRU40477.1 K+-transporting ATPase ATPase C chain [Clostridium beijerinckii]
MKIIKKSILLSITFMVLCGLIYPLLMTGISQLVFNRKANGSMITVNGNEVGSELIGQNFTDQRFFRGRISSVNYNTYTEADTVPDESGKAAYSGVASGSQNLAPSNDALKERVQKDIDDFLAANPGVKKEDIPTDLLTSSGSGLDPDISPESARIQIPSVSKASGIGEADLQKIVDKYTEGRTLGIFGEPRVNILKVNMEIASLLNIK